MARTHVILVNLGTPAAPTAEAVRAFLEEFLLDPLVVDYPGWFWRPILRRLVLKSRPVRVAELYRSIWHADGSPLEVGTRKITAALAARLGDDFRVTFAYRYGEPSLRGALEAARDAEAERIVAISLFPQRTCSTTGSIDRALDEHAAAAGVEARFERLAIEPDDPGYIEALAARHAEAIGGGPAPDRLLISFHGIPSRYDRRERGLYRSDCARTAAALRAKLGLTEAIAPLTYQSRFGPEPWIKPPTDRAIEASAAGGDRRLAVIAPGFLTDGLETLEELGEQGAESFREAGGEALTLVGAVEDHPAWIAALASRLAD